MDLRTQKYRMARWLGKLFVALSLVVPCGVKADTACSGWSSGQLLDLPIYPTQLEVAQAVIDYYNSYPWHIYAALTSCDGVSACYYTWISETYGVMHAMFGASCKVHSAPLIITLNGGTSVEPSKGAAVNTLPFIATVKNQSTGQPPTNPVEVHISLKVDPTSGGHDHGDSTRPRGGIAEKETCLSDNECWSHATDNGAVVFNLNAPEASGTYTIAAICDGCSNTATKPVDVKVDGLKPIPAFSFYALNETNGDVIGARTGWHTDNHNLTPAAAQKLMQIASWYRFLPQFKVVVDKSTGKKGLPPPLHINDASLPWGGVYDICARPDACPDVGVIAWQKPHAEHRRGTVVDVRANGADGSIPASNKAKFLKLLQKKGMSYLHESRGTSNEHFHVRLLGN